MPAEAANIIDIIAGPFALIDIILGWETAQNPMVMFTELMYASIGSLMWAVVLGAIVGLSR